MCASKLYTVSLATIKKYFIYLARILTRNTRITIKLIRLQLGTNFLSFPIWDRTFYFSRISVQFFCNNCEIHFFSNTCFTNISLITRTLLLVTNYRLNQELCFSSLKYLIKSDAVNRHISKFSFFIMIFSGQWFQPRRCVGAIPKPVIRN